MLGYIYKTIDLKNGKIYIGQHKSDTFVGESYPGSGRRIQNIRQSCIKQGIPLKERLHTELLEECETAEQLNEREIYWIAFYDSTNPEIGYNLHKGGLNTLDEHNGMHNKQHSEETKQLNREWHKCRIWITDGATDIFLTPEDAKSYLEKGFYRGRSKGSRKGQPRSVEASQKAADSLKGKHKTEECKQRLSHSRSSKIWVTDGISTKAIDKEELDQFLQQGWRRGRTFQANPWNKGQSAESNIKLKEIGQKTKNTRRSRNNYIPWNKKK